MQCLANIFSFSTENGSLVIEESTSPKHGAKLTPAQIRALAKELEAEADKLENNAMPHCIESELSTSDVFKKIKETVMAQEDQNELCPTDVVWIDREDLIDDLDKLESALLGEGDEQLSGTPSGIFCPACHEECVWDAMKNLACPECKEQYTE